MSDRLPPRVLDVEIDIHLWAEDVTALIRGEVPATLQNDLIGLVKRMHETPAERVRTGAA